jgi:lycopene beta-cyclase
LKKYDYIITGAGCAGLSLLVRMIDNGRFADKQILLLDKAPKTSNDRTWCFWEKGDGFFESIVYRQWEHTAVHGNQFSKQFALLPYRYKMIRGIDFYNYCFDKINACSNIDVQYGTISNPHYHKEGIVMTIDGVARQFGHATVFNSIWREETIRQQSSIYLLQHFKGWIIETAAPAFNSSEAILMDFRMPQTHGTTFAYLLPLTASSALVEYTLFSDKLLEAGAYKKGLTEYIEQRLGITAYTVTAEEFGVIPMTNAEFPWYANGVFHIGTAGGQTKASSGYTFQFIQKQTAAIVQSLLDGKLDKERRPLPTPHRFHFYDSVLLHILVNKKLGGDAIFTRLFEKNTAQAVFKFLDNETTLAEELSIIKCLPTGVFLRAAFAQWRR